MAHITSIRFWSDPGFTEGCIEIPGLNYVLPTASYVPLSMDGWRPAKNALFDKIKIEESFPNLINMSFLEAVFTFEDESEMTFYGWIDNVSILSDDTDHPVTIIDWHVDYWMTYRRNAQFKYGLVKRRSDSEDRPPQNPPYRFKRVNDTTELINISESTIFWLFINYIYEAELIVGQPPVTKRGRACIPVTRDNRSIFLRYNDNVTLDTPNWRQIISGSFDELYEIPPSNIISMYLSPIAPSRYNGQGTSSDPIDTDPLRDSWGVDYAKLDDTGTYGWLRWFSAEDEESVEWTYTLPTAVSTDDTTTYVITDFKGDPVGTLPYGIQVKDYTVRIVNSATAGYLQIRFGGWEGGSEGLTFNIPLTSMDLSTNSWSNYVYSGQKEYDAESKRIANEHSLVQGGISTISGGLSGAVTGGLMGSLGGPLGIVGGALVGGVGQMVGGAVSTGLSYAENLRYTDELLGVTAEYHANQLESVLIYGDTLDWLWHGKGPSLVTLRIDDYSRQLFANELNLLGARVSEPSSNCQSLIEAGGPLQIENLIVGGNIPARAKDYMRDRFRRGVRLI